MRNARFALVPLLVLPLAWLMLQGLGRDPRQIASPLIGRAAPDASLVSMDGDEVRLADLRGQQVLVNFWASWCFECIEEHRVLMRAQQRYGQRVAIVGILYADTVADARGFLARYGDGGWPNLIDAGGSVAIEFGVSGVPESFFIDADGLVRAKQWGALTDEVVETQLARLLGQSSPAGDD